MEVSELKRTKDLEEENWRLKKRPPRRMYAELSLEHEVVKEALKKTGPPGGGRACSASSVCALDC
jgi:hypothetical protein